MKNYEKVIPLWGEKKLCWLFLWIASALTCNQTWLRRDILLTLLRAICPASPRKHLCRSNHLSLTSTDEPRPCLETITFPGPFTKSSRPHPASSHPPSHPSAVMINPPCSHLCHRALLCLWFMGPAEDRTKGHRETDTKGGGEAAQHRKTLNRETF